MERFRHLLSALWLTLTGLTLAQINALLGFASLVIGISYQLWKWRKEAAKEWACLRAPASTLVIR